jgi:hypothetical protein
MPDTAADALPLVRAQRVSTPSHARHLAAATACLWAPFADATIDMLLDDSLHENGPRGGKYSRAERAAVYATRRSQISRLLNTSPTGLANASALITRLQATRGLQCNALGVRFDQRRHYSAHDPDVLALLRLLVFETPLTSHIDASLVNLRLWEADHDGRQLSAASNKGTTSGTAHALVSARLATGFWVSGLDALRSDGFLRVASWGTYGLDVGELLAQAHTAFAASTQGPQVVAPATRRLTTPLPALDALLRNAGLAATVRGYLGGPVRYDGHMLLEVAPHAQPATYRSAQWHHDRCGRRLKLFVYLDDVGADHGRPTLVARGTHELVHLSAGMQYGLSRFRDAFVSALYRVDALDGAAGGGFLLDTNALHRAGLERGNGTRRAVVLEFHGHSKVQRLGKVDNPCPMGRQKPHATAGALGNKWWWRGVPDYPLYPQEPAARSSEAKRRHWDVLLPYNRALAAALGVRVERLRAGSLL